MAKAGRCQAAISAWNQFCLVGRGLDGTMSTGFIVRPNQDLGVLLGGDRWMPGHLRVIVAMLL